MTPEGLVKKATRELLAQYKICPAKDAGAFPEDAQGWYYMPVPSGFGVAGIPDFIGHYRGWFFSVETKRKTKKAEGLQKLQIAAIAGTGGAVFVIDRVENLKEFEAWLKERR